MTILVPKAFSSNRPTLGFVSTQSHSEMAAPLAAGVLTEVLLGEIIHAIISSSN
jgi:hypothetical protein